MSRNRSYEIIVIGCSLGGINALVSIFKDLTPDFVIPIVIVLHRNKDSEKMLLQIINKEINFTVIEPDDKEEIKPGHIYLAPPNYHLLIEASYNPYFALSTDFPVNYARPSIDTLFESASDTFEDKMIGIILTGSNMDGVSGLKKIKMRGGLTIVQQPETAECPEMAKNAIKEFEVDKILSLAEISFFLNNITRDKRMNR